MVYIKTFYFKGVKQNVLIHDKEQELTAAHIVWMLRNVPNDIKDIFIPKTIEDVDQLAINTAKFIHRSAERDIVMKIQKSMGLPIRPNESLYRTMILLRIAEFKKAHVKKRRRKNDYE
jgi:hypothetical protein